MQKIIVIGDGVLGGMIAAELEGRGAAVTQIVGPQPRASDASLVWLNVSSASNPAYAALRLASMQGWRRLVVDAAAPVRFMGALMWEDGLDTVSEAARLSTLGWQTEAIGKDRFATLAPGIAEPPDKALWMPEEGACDPVEMMDWVAGRLGGVARISASVETLITSDARVTGVRLADGRDLMADTVVIAAGTGCVDLLRPFGVAVPLRHAPGMLFRTAPVGRMTGPIQASPITDFWQDDAGRLIVATDWDKVLEDAAPQAAKDTLARLRAVMPGIGTPEIETIAERNRPVPQDGFPLVGQVAPGAQLVVTHSGMTLAPILALCVAADVLGQDQPHDLGPFRPDRLCEVLV